MWRWFVHPTVILEGMLLCIKAAEFAVVAAQQELAERATLLVITHWVQQGRVMGARQYACDAQQAVVVQVLLLTFDLCVDGHVQPSLLVHWQQLVGLLCLLQLQPCNSSGSLFSCLSSIRRGPVLLDVGDGVLQPPFLQHLQAA